MTVLHPHTHHHRCEKCIAESNAKKRGKIPEEISSGYCEFTTQKSMHNLGRNAHFTLREIK
jgi:hypothetical protein